MLFNSDAFLFVFLPFVLAGFFACGAVARGACVAWLVAASLAFYAWWNVAHLWVPVVSLAFNFAIATAIDRGRDRPRRARLLLAFGIAANVLLLFNFKALISPWFGASGEAGAFSTSLAIAIPLGISFITFQQIAFLADTWRGRVVAPRAGEYACFLMFFPQLVMGPILHYRDIAPQLSAPGFGRANAVDIACGLSILAVGLFKKVMIADNLAPSVDRIFDMVAQGVPLSPVEAWGVAIAFQFQIYFDFSGYADMAIGIGRMFGVRLPINFDAPYRAVDRFDLWRRWHITLAVFMRQYVFMPLVKNRLLPMRAWVALLATTVISGLWHGLGWTFLLWGVAQGLLLLGDHAIRQWLPARAPGRDLITILRIAATLVLTAAMGVLFRSSDLDAAHRLLGSLVGTEGFWVPQPLVALWDATVGRLLAALGIPDIEWTVGSWVWAPDGLLTVAFAAAIIWFAPATHRLFEKVWTGQDPRAPRDVPQTLQGPLERRIRFSLSPGWALFVATLLVLSILYLDGSSRFVYYQF